MPKRRQIDNYLDQTSQKEGDMEQYPFKANEQEAQIRLALLLSDVIKLNRLKNKRKKGNGKQALAITP